MRNDKSIDLTITYTKRTACPFSHFIIYCHPQTHDPLYISYHHMRVRIHHIVFSIYMKHVPSVIHGKQITRSISNSRTTHEKIYMYKGSKEIVIFILVWKTQFLFSCLEL